MNIIDFENIFVKYDRDFVLKQLNLKIKEGEHWAILGANGSGKSTLMKLIQSQIHPIAKYPFRKEIFGKSRYSIFDLKKALGIVTNDLHNYLEKDANFLDAYTLVLSGFYNSIGVFKYQDFTQEQHQKALEVMKFLEIEKLRDKKVYQMSTGELRKTIIGRALIHEPKAFVLDEPTVGLDLKAQYNFIETLRKISSKSSIILVTHHLEEIFDKITHVALLCDNKIYKSGNKKDILTSENLSKIFNIDLEIQCLNQRYFIKKIKS